MPGAKARSSSSNFDLPGINEESLDLDIERNVVTVRAERPDIDPGREMLATERPRGVFSRQLVLGDNLDTDNIDALYDGGSAAAADPGGGEGKASQDRDRAAATATRSSTPDRSASADGGGQAMNTHLDTLVASATSEAIDSPDQQALHLLMIPMWRRCSPRSTPSCVRR